MTVFDMPTTQGIIFYVMRHYTAEELAHTNIETLANMVSVAPGTVMGYLRKLKNAGYIQMLPGEDQNHKIIIMTPAGQQMWYDSIDEERKVVAVLERFYQVKPQKIHEP